MEKEIKKDLEMVPLVLWLTMVTAVSIRSTKVVDATAMPAVIPFGNTKVPDNDNNSEIYVFRKDGSVKPCIATYASSSFEPSNGTLNTPKSYTPSAVPEKTATLNSISMAAPVTTTTSDVKALPTLSFPAATSEGYTTPQTVVSVAPVIATTTTTSQPSNANGYQSLRTSTTDSGSPAPETTSRSDKGDVSVNNPTTTTEYSQPLQTDEGTIPVSSQGDPTASETTSSSSRVIDDISAPTSHSTEYLQGATTDFAPASSTDPITTSEATPTLTSPSPHTTSTDTPQQPEPKQPQTTTTTTINGNQGYAKPPPSIPAASPPPAPVKDKDYGTCATCGEPVKGCHSCGLKSPDYVNYVDAHNSLRSKYYKANFLVYDAKLAQEAYNHLVTMSGGDCSRLDHEGHINENLYEESISEEHFYNEPNVWNNPYLTKAVNDWHSENHDYFYASVNNTNWNDFYGFQPEVGHFSAMMWQSVTKVGCASRICNQGSSIAIACHYGDIAPNLVGDNPFNNHA